MPSPPRDSPGADMADNPLSRIQREINEVAEREDEFRRTHATFTRKLSESDIELERTSTNGHSSPHENGTHQNTMVKAYSTSHLTYSAPKTGPVSPTSPTPKPITNGFTRRYTPNTGQKGIMQRFIASRGQMNLPPLKTTTPPVLKQAFFPSAIASHPIATTRTSDGKLMRKGFVPVEEKIQKELKDLKDREIELKKLRKKSNSYQLDLSSLDDSDEDYESDAEYDIPEPGKLRPTKSIGELYESLGDMSSPSPPNAPSSESYGSLKPAKSLAELCDLGPDEEALAPSSTKLIAKWESLIQQKQESGAA